MPCPAPTRALPPAPARAPRKSVAAFVWDLAYKDYMAGQTARVVAARYDIGVSNLRQTFSRRGWNRKALTEARAQIHLGAHAPQRSPAPAPDPAPDPAPGPRPDETLFDTVLRRAREALTAGKGSEATALLKAVRDYVVVIDDVSDAEAANEPIEHAIGEILPADRTRWREAMAMNKLRVFWSPLQPHELEYRESDRAFARTDREARAGQTAAAAKRTRRRVKKGGEGAPPAPEQEPPSRRPPV